MLHRQIQPKSHEKFHERGWEMGGIYPESERKLTQLSMTGNLGELKRIPLAILMIHAILKFHPKFTRKPVESAKGQNYTEICGICPETTGVESPERK